MAKMLKMKFGLDSGKDYTMSLADPKEGLNEALVKPAMQGIVTKDALLVRGAKAITVKSAEIREVTTTKIFG